MSENKIIDRQAKEAKDEEVKKAPVKKKINALTPTKKTEAEEVVARYKLQNPTKYETKKEALKKWVESFK
jgi:hypothetical protein